MSDYCVVLVNGARARFFCLEPTQITDLEGGPNLIETKDLVNAEKGIPSGELWTNIKSGRNRSPAGGQAHGYDDHRSEHNDEFKRRFARNVAQEATRLVQQNHTRTLILAAEKRMLGFLRSELDPLVKTGVDLHSLAKDISKLSPREIHSYLAKENLVPERKFERA